MLESFQKVHRAEMGSEVKRMEY